MDEPGRSTWAAALNVDMGPSGYSSMAAVNSSVVDLAWESSGSIRVGTYHLAPAAKPTPPGPPPNSSSSRRVNWFNAGGGWTVCTDGLDLAGCAVASRALSSLASGMV